VHTEPNEMFEEHAMTTTTTTQAPMISPEAFHGSESGYVYGIVDDPDHDVAVIAAELVADGVPVEAIHVYRSCEISDTAANGRGRHPFLARIHRTLQAADGHRQSVAAELAKGRALIGVAVDDDRKDEISEALRRHRSHDIVYYGRYTWQWLGA
jgi:hypothetical protein